MVLFLKELLHISNFQHKVQALQTVENVNHVVVGVLFEVSESHFTSKADQSLQFDVGVAVYVVELEKFVNHELKTIVV